MAKNKNDEVTVDDLVDFGLKQVLQAFGKGQDLRGAVWGIVSATATWATENEKKRHK